MTGADGEARTPDLLITNQVLCQLSYVSIWSCKGDLNPRPADYKAAALPTELLQHGAPGETRTPDKRIKNPPLYQLSYRSISFEVAHTFHLPGLLKPTFLAEGSQPYIARPDGDRQEGDKRVPPTCPQSDINPSPSRVYRPCKMLSACAGRRHTAPNKKHPWLGCSGATNGT